MYYYHNALNRSVFVCTSCWLEPRLERRGVKLSPRSIWLQPRTWTPSGLLGQDCLSISSSVISTLLIHTVDHYADIASLTSNPRLICCQHVSCVCLISTGLPAVLCVILWLLWQGEENWQCRVPVAPRLLHGRDGRLRLQFHYSVEKVIITLFTTHTDVICVQ